MGTRERSIGCAGKGGKEGVLERVGVEVGAGEELTIETEWDVETPVSGGCNNGSQSLWLYKTYSSCINIMQSIYNAHGLKRKEWTSEFVSSEKMSNLLLHGPRKCFQRNDMYDTEPKVQSDVV